MCECTTLYVIPSMILWIYIFMPSLGKLLPEGPCFMQQGVNFAEVLHVKYFSASTLSCYHTPRHNQRHTAHTNIY